MPVKTGHNDPKTLTNDVFPQPFGPDIIQCIPGFNYYSESKDFQNIRVLRK